MLFTATPSEPCTLVVDQIGTILLQISWESPLIARKPITFYSITAHHPNATGDDTVIRNTTTSATSFNVTDLLPGTSYELTVVAVSQGGDVFATSQPSESVRATTGFVGQCYILAITLTLSLMITDL